MSAAQDYLNLLIIRFVNKALDERLGDIISGGQLRLRGVPLTGGPLPTTGGGTGTTTGFKDHGHSGGSDGQLLEEAHTHQDLDTNPTSRIHWSKEDIQDMIASGFLVAGAGITLIYDDAANTLTIDGGGSEIPPPPDTYVYLTDGDGAYLTDADGAYLWEYA